MNKKNYQTPICAKFENFVLAIPTAILVVVYRNGKE